MSRVHWGIAIALTVLTVIFTAAVYASLPEKIPTHWNIKGEIDAWSSKQWAAWLLPAMMVFFLGLFRLLPWLSPKNFEIDTFRNTYAFIIMLVMGLFALIDVMTILPGLGYKIDVGRMLMGCLLVFFMLMGNVLGKVQPNFFVGVRTPWTIASSRVWSDTHRMAAWVFVGAGAIGLAVILVGLPPVATFIVSISLIMAAALWVVLYSLVRYKQLERRGEL